jgi:hypothetical protein
MFVARLAGWLLDIGASPYVASRESKRERLNSTARWVGGWVHGAAAVHFDAADPNELMTPSCGHTRDCHRRRVGLSPINISSAPYACTTLRCFSAAPLNPGGKYAILALFLFNNSEHFK